MGKRWSVFGGWRGSGLLEIVFINFTSQLLFVLLNSRLKDVVSQVIFHLFSSLFHFIKSIFEDKCIEVNTTEY